ncbi:hypothetical protein QE422_001641 [Chryseobacterium sp. SORGH_AS 447]|uniref:hypothetical protein n=1 Tax=Chryseobacterium sp. SORGH_AS_0447 TaxID=3041769 RepID=UPI00278B7FBA|nr:hypothetical protein [Chryseobacterium sp. SORGH_AS_0447]MDQ1161273.1 hypothetical protein [Chryseobacterium sp. SORGH_AS_0447]
MRDKNLILNPVFVGCLTLLFLNDHLFKTMYHNGATGKLSDMAGIVLFPMLLAYLFPKFRENAVFVAGAFFIFWKSPFSGSLITLYNRVSPISIHRVVDYTDLWVLLLLPIPYFLIKNSFYLKKINFLKVNVFAVLIPTVFVLMSTSPPYSYFYISEKGTLVFKGASIEIKKTKTDLLREMDVHHVAWVKDTAEVIESLRFETSRMGKFDQNALKNGGAIFTIDNDELRLLILRKIYESSDYKIPELKIGDRTVKNLRLSIEPSYREINSKKFSTVVIREVEIDKNLDHDKAGKELRKIYQDIIISKFKNF